MPHKSKGRIQCATCVSYYWMLDFGVEQLFALPRRPAGTGDLVLTGLLSTTLAPAAQGDVGQAVFPLPGGGALTYGPAAILDARGNSAPVGLALQDGQVRLTVPGDWPEDARFPVVVDPFFTDENNITNDGPNEVTPAVAGGAGPAGAVNCGGLTEWDSPMPALACDPDAARCLVARHMQDDDIYVGLILR
jgi:hypothetical protein